MYVSLYLWSLLLLKYAEPCFRHLFTVYIVPLAPASASVEFMPRQCIYVYLLMYLYPYSTYPYLHLYLFLFALECVTFTFMCCL